MVQSVQHRCRPANGLWGCEVTTTNGQTKYVKTVNTTNLGEILVESQGVNNKVDGTARRALLSWSRNSRNSTSINAAGKLISKWICGGTAMGMPGVTGMAPPS